MNFIVLCILTVFMQTLHCVSSIHPMLIKIRQYLIGSNKEFIDEVWESNSQNIIGVIGKQQWKKERKTWSFLNEVSIVAL